MFSGHHHLVGQRIRRVNIQSIDIYFANYNPVFLANRRDLYIFARKSNRYLQWENEYWI